jgi:hypothetical protein
VIRSDGAPRVRVVIRSDGAPRVRVVIRSDGAPRARARSPQTPAGGYPARRRSTKSVF